MSSESIMIKSYIGLIRKATWFISMYFVHFEHLIPQKEFDDQ